jgi:SAM-dependent methyltransferase
MSLNEQLIYSVYQCQIVKNISTFVSHGHCLACNQDTEFIIDEGFEDAIHLYREGLRCKKCGLISRQRAVIYYLKRLADPGYCIYFQEQTSSAFRLAVAQLPRCDIVGSEYTCLPNCRQENVQHLSFTDAQFDIIVSQDVFEHVQDPWQGFRECFRVLKPGGHMLMTIPFSDNPDWKSIDREAAGLPNSFHVDPHSDQGALVYTDFGWDINERLENIGFQTRLLAVWSAYHGHPGPILLWHLTRPRSI